jgi:hypothetical protein
MGGGGGVVIETVGNGYVKEGGETMQEGMRIIFESPEVLRNFVRLEMGRAVMKAWRVGFLAGWLGAGVVVAAVMVLYWWAH